MIGCDAYGDECTLTAEQARIVRQLLYWEMTGETVILPTMGRGSGKTTIMNTVAWYQKRRGKLAELMAEVDED